MAHAPWRVLVGLWEEGGGGERRGRRGGRARVYTAAGGRGRRTWRGDGGGTMVMAHFVENFWVRERCWKLCGFRSRRLSAPAFGLRAFWAVAAAPRAGQASSDRRLLGPAWMKPGGRRASGRPDSQARSPCGGKGAVSAAPQPAAGTPRSRLLPALGQSAGWGGRRDPAPPEASGAGRTPRLRRALPARGAAAPSCALQASARPSRVEGAPSFPQCCPPTPHYFHEKSRAGWGRICTSSRFRSSAGGSAPRTLPLGLFTKRIKVEFNVTGFLGLKCTETSRCPLDPSLSSFFLQASS